MRDKKDIGSFFEDKLKDGKRSPDENLWDKINTSLEKIEHRKKSTLLYWLIGFGVLILVGTFLFTNLSIGIKQDSQIPNSNNSLEIPFSDLEEKSNIIEEKDSTINSLENLKISEEEQLLEIPNKDNVPKDVQQKGTDIVSGAKTKKTSVKRTDMDENFNVTTKYYYYNGDDGKEIITTNKHLIDSVLNEKNKIVDSISLPKKDTQREP